VNALVLCLGATLAVGPESTGPEPAAPDPTASVLTTPVPTTQDTYFSAQSYFDAPLVSQIPATGQNPVIAQNPGHATYEDDALNGSPGMQTYAPGGAPFGSDPLLGEPPGAELGRVYDPGLAFGAVGPQPYRFGWTSRDDVAFMPAEGVHGGGSRGSFGITEFNAALRYTTGVPAGTPNMIFSWTPEFNYRSWSGPTSPDLPANVFRFASDFELATPANNPVSMQLGFTPAFASDFVASPTSDAFNYDARGVVFVRTSPQLMLALGVTYWHRVQDFLLPYAGVVWTPNDNWEFRLMFPKSRISYFLGNWWGGSAWAYGSLEYNVEAYQINSQIPQNIDDKIQISDYRALFGLRSEGGGVTTFVEVGWVFDRQAVFQHTLRDFDIDTGFIGRLGLRF
jgi:hypothetical protein